MLRCRMGRAGGEVHRAGCLPPVQSLHTGPEKPGVCVTGTSKLIWAGLMLPWVARTCLFSQTYCQAQRVSSCLSLWSRQRNSGIRQG